MMLFQRRLFMEMLRSFLATLTVLVVIMLLILSTRIVHEIEGLDPATFFALVPLNVMMAFDLVLPISVLVAVVLTYSRAAADAEFDTLKAGGVNPVHFFTPGLVFGALLTVVLVWVMDEGRPMADRQYRHITKNANITNIIRNRLSAGEPVKLDERTIMAVDRFDPETGKALDMRIQIFDEEGELEMELLGEGDLYLDKDKGVWRLTLENFRTIKGERFVGDQMNIERKLPKEVYELRPEHLFTSQLVRWLQREKAVRGGFRQLDVETHLHTRIALPYVCFLFVLIGIPAALIFRTQDRVAGFLIAFLLALFIFYPAMEMSKSMAEAGTLTPPMAAWAGNLFIGLVGLGASVVVVRR